MAEYYIAPKSSFDATADAIREKTGSQATIEWTEDGFADAIEEISGGGSVWTRPADWPNLDAMDISGDDVLYLTYAADEETGFCAFLCTTFSGAYIVDIGDIVNGQFITESTYTVNANAWFRQYWGTSAGGYKVLRVSGNLKSFNIYATSVSNYDGTYRYDGSQGLLEVRGKTQNLTSISFRAKVFLQRVYLFGSSITSSQYMFYGCYSLVLAELPNIITDSVTTMSSMFAYDSSLKMIDATNWDTKNVTSIGDFFYGCVALEEADQVENWDVGKVTNFNSFFYNCNNLKEAKIGKWNTESATSFYQFMNLCRLVESADISNFKMGSVTTVQNMLSGCNRLKKVDISKWDMSNVTNSSALFNNDSALTKSITIPASLGVIGTQMFNATRQLTEYHFLSTTPPTLSNTNAFSNMTDASGNKIYVPYSADHSVLDAYKTATNWSTYASYIYEEAAP